MKQMMPLAKTSAMLATWPLSLVTSRRSFRSSARIHMALPAELACPEAPIDLSLALDAAIAESDHSIGNLRNGCVVCNDRGRGAELSVHTLDDFEHHDTSSKIERPRGLVA